MNTYGLRLNEVKGREFRRWVQELSRDNTAFRCGLCGDPGTVTRIRRSNPNEGSVEVLEFAVACPCDPNAETTITMTRQK